MIAAVYTVCVHMVNVAQMARLCVEEGVVEIFLGEDRAY